MIEHKHKKMKHFEGRWAHLYRLWLLALSHEQLPQLDKWLSQEFAKNSKFGSRDRKWYSECLFSGVRFGYFALFCESLFKTCNRSIFTEKDIYDHINSFSELICDEKALLKAWKNISVERFFVWVRLRYQLLQKESDVIIESPVISFKEEAHFFEQIKFLIASSTNIKLQMLFASVPLWYENDLLKRFQFSNWDAHTVKSFLQQQDTRPPLWLRINDLDKTTSILAELQREGFAYELNNTSLRVSGTKGVYSLSSYRSGWFEIQDLASQQIGFSVQAKPGQFLWDACAGGGGKTQQLASALKNKGVIYASDIREYKLEEVKKRSRRAGFFNIRCLVWNGKDLPIFQKEVVKREGFDWVLVDAPCSSSGTWRRNPDAKYRTGRENLNNLTKLQLQILHSASASVLPNGHLVYSTCSWIVEENEKVVEEFLAQNKNFSLVEQKLLGAPLQDSDTMFVAVLARKSAA